MTVYNPDEDAIKLEQSIYFLIYKRPSKTKSFDPDVRKKMFDEEDMPTYNMSCKTNLKEF